MDGMQAVGMHCGAVGAVVDAVTEGVGEFSPVVL